MIRPRLSVLLFVLATVSTGSASVFVAPTTYPCGELPVAVAIQDFNHDGSADIATANNNDNNVSIFLNKGDGTFAAATNILSEINGASDIASADLDDDGNLDLVVADRAELLNITLGHGDGTFGPATTIDVTNFSGDYPNVIAIADLNSDGILDLAVGLYQEEFDTQGRVSILIGQGEGSFAPPVFYPLMEAPTGLVATDLNNDGVLDLALSVYGFINPDKDLAVLLGNGNGTFQPAVRSLDGGYASDIAAGDFNADGKMDLALTQNYLDEMWVVLGNGDGTFQPATVYSGLDYPSHITAADLTGDNIPDLVVDGESVFLADGTGGFGAPTFYSIGSGGAEIGYLDSDRVPDLVATGFSEIVVAMGHGHGAFKAPFEYSVGGEGYDSADFDGDGNADVVVSNRYFVADPGIYFVRGVGDGTLADPISFSTLIADDLVAADLNRDRKADILFTVGNENLYTMLGNGDGTFQSAQMITVDATELSFPALGDFNNDRQPDLAITDWPSDTLMVLLGNGDGSFQPALKIRTGDVPQSPTVADFNLDHNLDVVVSNTFGGTVGVYLGHGDGTFDSPLTTSLRSALYSAAADLNKDGKLDLVIAGDGLQVLLGNGDGTFEPPAKVYAKDGPLTIVDVDRDGRLDIVVSGNFTTLAVLRGQGDGTFRPAVEFDTGSTVENIVMKDLNHDKLPEALVSDGFAALTVLFNTSHAK